MKVIILLFFWVMQDYGHRVRLATHSNFKEFVLTAGLEFFPLGGDPKVLAGCKYPPHINLPVHNTFLLSVILLSSFHCKPQTTLA